MTTGTAIDTFVAWGSDALALSTAFPWRGLRATPHGVLVWGHEGG